MRFLDKHRSFEKQLRRLAREYNRLSQARWNAPLIPVDQAFQCGWEKTYVLRDDIRLRPDLRVFSEILGEVNQRIYSRNREFKHWSGRQMFLRPRIIPVARWLQLNWPASHKRWFAYGHWREEGDHWRPDHLRRHTLGFRLERDWWLEERIQPFMVTHLRVELPEVRSRMAEISAFMEATHGWRRLGRLQGQSDWWRRLCWSRAEVREQADYQAELAENQT